MLKNLVLIILLCMILGIFECIRECRNFTVTHYNITSKHFKSNDKHHKVVVLSDLHNKEYGKGNQKLLQAIKAESPDAILVAGDMLVGAKGVATDAAINITKELVKIAPVYYGNGNHEQRMKEEPQIYGPIYMEYKKELLNAGVNLLENESKDILLGDIPITITGLEIPSHYYERCNTYEFKVSDIEEQVGKASDKYQVLISHNPTYSRQYVKWGADLVVSGHFHGGIVRIPFLGAVFTPQFKMFPEYSGGHYKYNESDIVVSKGLGEHTIKLRFCNYPELIVLHLLDIQDK